VWATGEIAFLEAKVVQHSLDDRYVLGLTAVGRARDRELFFAPLERIEAAGAQKWKDLEGFRAAAPEGERVRVAGATEQFVAFANYRGVYSVFRLGSLAAGDCNIELVRLDHIPR
jgi:hypothetical protein